MYAWEKKGEQAFRNLCISKSVNIRSGVREQAERKVDLDACGLGRQI